MQIHRRLAMASLFLTIFAALPSASPTAQVSSAAGTRHPPPACPAPLERWTQVDLYLGRSIAKGGVVTEGMFRRFLAEVVTPRFPDGLSVLDVAGQFRDSRGRIVREPSKLLVLLVPDRVAAAARIAAVVERYKRRFSQESVLRTERAVCLAF